MKYTLIPTELLERIDDSLVNLMNEGRTYHKLRSQVLSCLQPDEPLSTEWLSKSEFILDEREDDDGDKYIVWFFNGIDIYDLQDTGGGFAYATYVRGSGGFKGGFTISTINQLKNFVWSLSGKELSHA